MSKTSRRAAVIAASFALGLSCVGPAAQASLLDDGLTEVIPTDLAGGLLGGDGGGLLGLGLLGGDGGGLLGLGLLGGEGGLPLVGSLLGGEGGLPLVGGLLGGEGGALGLLGGEGGLPLVGDVLGGDLLGGGLPLVGGILGEDGVLGGEMLDVVTDTTLSCDAAIPQVLYAFLGDVTEAICAPFSSGLFGLLGSL